MMITYRKESLSNCDTHERQLRWRHLRVRGRSRWRPISLFFYSATTLCFFCVLLNPFMSGDSSSVWQQESQEASQRSDMKSQKCRIKVSHNLLRTERNRKYFICMSDISKKWEQRNEILDVHFICLFLLCFYYSVYYTYVRRTYM